MIKGVKVSCLAKKLADKTLINIKANKPSEKACKLIAVMIASLSLKFPLTKSNSMIGNPKQKSAIDDGIAKIKMSSIPHLKFSLNSRYFSATYSPDNLGRITVAIAIPKIPSGSCINLSER